ncbi:MAG: hypothetical protein COA68_13295 [Oceanobacter sp.]|jgi:hypothetical protein|nr:MAG: hypothetical protein COA68_13295 [Oceanobacter sp.]
MFKFILTAVIALCTQVAMADGTFNYSGLIANGGFVKRGLEDTDQELVASNIGLTLNNELSNQFFLSLSLGHQVIDDDIYYDGVYGQFAGTSTSVSLGLGRYFSVNPLLDVYFSGGIILSRYNTDALFTDAFGNSLYIEESESDSAIGATLAARMLLNSNGKVELMPRLQLTSNEGESDTSAGMAIALNTSKKLSFGFSFDTSLKEDVTAFGLFGRLYF